MVGQTRGLPHGRQSDCERELEIQQYLADNHISSDVWLAIDDQPDLFRNLNQVLVTNPNDGLTAANVNIWLSK